MLFISRKGLHTAHLSALRAEVGRTVLKHSDTRSFIREKKFITLKGDLVLIKGKNNKNILKILLLVFIPDLAKAVLIVLPAAKPELWHCMPGEDPTPWLFVFSSVRSSAFIQLILCVPSKTSFT